MILNDETLWKLLQYPTNDALSKADLTTAQKGALIYRGQEDSTPFRVFTSPFLDDAFDEKQTQIRIYSGTIVPETYVTGIVDFNIDLLCHNKIQILNSAQHRLDVAFENVMQALNGRNIESLGVLYFNEDRRRTNQSGWFKPNDYYVGRRIVMSANYVG